MSPTIGMDVDPELEISQTACNVLGWSEVTPVITMVIKTTFKRRENDVFTRKRSCEIDV